MHRIEKNTVFFQGKKKNKKVFFADNKNNKFLIKLIKI